MKGKRRIARFAWLASGCMAVVLLVVYLLVCQPVFTPYHGRFAGNLPAADARNLQRHVRFLAANECTSPAGQEIIGRYILEELKQAGIPAGNVEIQPYRVGRAEYRNIVVHFGAGNARKYILGAHYDAFAGMPGADDNASGTAALLECAAILRAVDWAKQKQAIDLVFYSTEEQPFFGSESMGSFVHAQWTRNDRRVALVVILEMIGCFSEVPGSQKFPLAPLRLLYPRTGNFIALVSDFSTLSWTRRCKQRMRTFLMRRGRIGVESINAPAWIPGLDFSDHRNYLSLGIPAVMVTDTAFYRNPYYHTRHDTPETLDYDKMKDIVDAVAATMLSLVGEVHEQ